MLPKYVTIPDALKAQALKTLGAWEAAAHPALFNKKLTIVLGGLYAYKLIDGTFTANDADFISFHIASQNTAENDELKQLGEIIWNECVYINPALTGFPVVFGRHDALSNGEFHIDALSGAIYHPFPTLNAERTENPAAIDSEIFIRQSMIITPKLEKIILAAKNEAQNGISPENSSGFDTLSRLFNDYMIWLGLGKMFSLETARLINSLLAETDKRYATLSGFHYIQAAALLAIHYNNAMKLSESLNALTQKSLTQEEQLNEAKESAASMQYDRDTALAQLAETKKQLEGSTLEITQLQTESNQSTQEFRTQITSLTERLDGKDRVHALFMRATEEQHEHRISELETANRTIQASAAQTEAKLLERIKQLETERQTLTTRVETLETQKEHSEKQNRRLESEKTKLEKDLKLALEKNREIDVAIQNMAREVTDAQVGRDTALKSNATLFKQKNAALEEVKMLKQKIELLTTKKPKPKITTSHSNKNESSVQTIVPSTPVNKPEEIKQAIVEAANSKPEATAPVPATVIETPPKELSSDQIRYAVASHIIALLSSAEPSKVPSFEDAYKNYLTESNSDKAEVNAVANFVNAELANFEQARSYTYVNRGIIKGLLSIKNNPAILFKTLMVEIDAVLDVMITSHENYLPGDQRFSLYMNRLISLINISKTPAFKNGTVIQNQLDLAELFVQALNESSSGKAPQDIIDALDALGEPHHKMIKSKHLILAMQKELKSSPKNSAGPVNVLNTPLPADQRAFYESLLKLNNDLKYLKVAYFRFTGTLRLNNLTISDHEIISIFTAYAIRHQLNLIDDVWKPIIKQHFEALESLDKKINVKKATESQTRITLDRVYHSLVTHFPGHSVDEYAEIHLAACARWTLDTRNKRISADSSLVSTTTAVFNELHPKEIEAKSQSTLSVLPEATQDELKKMLCIHLIRAMEIAKRENTSLSLSPSFLPDFKSLLDTVRSSEKQNLISITDFKGALAFFPTQFSPEVTEDIALTYLQCIDVFYQMANSQDPTDVLLQFIVFIDNRPLPTMFAHHKDKHIRLKEIVDLLEKVIKFLKTDLLKERFHDQSDIAVRESTNYAHTLLNQDEFKASTLKKLHRVGDLVRLFCKNIAVLHIARDSLVNAKRFYYGKPEAALYNAIVLHMASEDPTNPPTAKNKEDLLELEQAQQYFYYCSLVYADQHNISPLQLAEIKTILAALLDGTKQLAKEAGKGELDNLAFMHEQYQLTRENLAILLTINQHTDYGPIIQEIGKPHNSAALAALATPEKLKTLMGLYLLKCIRLLSVQNSNLMSMRYFLAEYNNLEKSLMLLEQHPDKLSGHQQMISGLKTPDNSKEASTLSFHYCQALNIIIKLSTYTDPEQWKKELLNSLSEMDNLTHGNPDTPLSREKATLRFNAIRYRYIELNSFLNAPEASTIHINFSAEIRSTAKQIVNYLQSNASILEILHSVVLVGDTQRFLMDHQSIIIEAHRHMMEKIPYTSEMMKFQQAYQQYLQIILTQAGEQSIQVTDLIDKYFLENLKATGKEIPREDWIRLCASLSQSNGVLSKTKVATATMQLHITFNASGNPSQQKAPPSAKVANTK